MIAQVEDLLGRAIDDICLQFLTLLIPHDFCSVYLGALFVCTSLHSSRTHIDHEERKESDQQTRLLRVL